MSKNTKNTMARKEAKTTNDSRRKAKNRHHPYKTTVKVEVSNGQDQWADVASNVASNVVPKVELEPKVEEGEMRSFEKNAITEDLDGHKADGAAPSKRQTRSETRKKKNTADKGEASEKTPFKPAPKKAAAAAGKKNANSKPKAQKKNAGKKAKEDPEEEEGSEMAGETSQEKAATGSEEKGSQNGDSEAPAEPAKGGRKAPAKKGKKATEDASKAAKGKEKAGSAKKGTVPTPGKDATTQTDLFPPTRATVDDGGSNVFVVKGERTHYRRPGQSMKEAMAELLTEELKTTVQAEHILVVDRQPRENEARVKIQPRSSSLRGLHAALHGRPVTGVSIWRHTDRDDVGRRLLRVKEAQVINDFRLSRQNYEVQWKAKDKFYRIVEPVLKFFESQL